jgi:hypothetical protein
MGHAGYNSPANNRDGYASKAKALAAHLHYKGGPARRAAKAAERDAKVAQSSKVMVPNGADETVGVLAESLNAHLTAGGWVLVETQTTRLLYKARHAGMFFNTESGDLRSRSGRGSVFLGSPKSGLLVAIRWGSGVTPR